MLEFWKSDLSKNEQIVYSYFISQYALRKREIVAPRAISNDAILKVYSAILYDHPELYCLPNVCSCAQQISLLGKQNIYMVKDLYSASEDEKIRLHIRQLQRDLKAKVNKNDHFSAIKEVAKWLMENVSYQIDNEFNQNAASAIYYKRAQCSGYSKAFKFLMDSFNIPCIVVQGKVKESSDANHAWNLVKLEESWYHIDVTNMSTQNSLEESIYFLVSDEAIKKTHDWNVNIPKCSKSFLSKEEEEVFYSTYEVGVHLKRAYLKRETLVRFNAEICDEPSLSQKRTLDFIKKWYSQNANNIKYRIQAKDIKFKIEIEYIQ